nr:hypothetical protein GOBAR_AA36262 [Ipomoea trifida]
MHIGDVNFQMYDDIARTLHDIRHIPELTKNMIFLAICMLMVLFINLKVIEKPLKSVKRCYNCDETEKDHGKHL